MKLAAAAVLVVSLAGCSSDEPEAEPELEPTPTVSATPTPTPSPTTEPDPGVRRLVVPPAAESLPRTWTEAFVIPYGKGRDKLGTSQGGDSGGTVYHGPEYGVPGPDGTWWFLDLAKERIAHYDASGRYLDRVRNTTPWVLPHILADGTFYAARYNTDASSQLLRLRDGTIDVVDVDGAFFPSYDDGVSLFGSVDGNEHGMVDPDTGALERVDTFTTPAGTPFSLSMDFDRGRLALELPNAGISRSIPIRTASGAEAHVGLEVVAGADDVIHLFLAGTGEDDESRQLVGYSSVSPAGAVSQVEALPDPFSPSDPGSPANLVIAPGSSTPMLVYVLEDGVHVYERVGTNGKPG